jgi:hypothetical protein
LAVGEGRKRLVEELGIELVRFPVDVEVGAGNRAAIRGAPRAATLEKSSSTKQSSDFRKVWASRREASRKAFG